MDQQIASIAVHVGAKYWPLPMDYAEEAGRFDMPGIDDDKLISHRIGGGRGLNVRIPAVPALPEGWVFEPFISQIFVFHNIARMEWDGDLVDLLGFLAGHQWRGKEKIENEIGLTYTVAHRLIADYGISLEEAPFFAYRVHGLLYKAMPAPGCADAPRMARYLAHNVSFHPGVFWQSDLAARPFVRYAEAGDAIEDDDPRITIAYITDDPEEVYDPTGRTGAQNV